MSRPDDELVGVILTDESDEIPPLVTVGGAMYGVDVPLRLERGRVVLGPARVRLHGVEYDLGAHVYDLVVAEHDRVVSVGLVLEDELPRVRVYEERADELDPYPGEVAPVLVAIATLDIPAGAMEPTRVQRMVMTPAPPMEQAIQAAPVPVLRPKPEPPERIEERARRRALERELAARRANPIPAADVTRPELDALVLLLARAQGLVR